MKAKTFLPLAILGLFLPSMAAAVPSAYPEVLILSQDDALFIQQQAELDAFRRIAESRNHGDTPFPPLSIFEYGKRRAEDLFSLNARLGLRYDTLATLNGTAGKPAFDARSRVLIPSQDGIFVNNPPRGWLEEIMFSTRIAAGEKPLSLLITREGKKEPVSFFPDAAFTGIERKYFLGMLLRLPLSTLRITSIYGWRSDPFTGKPEFHEGLDLGAPEGAEVLAAREGVVAEAGRDAILGNYIVLFHAGGLRTVYGHLSAIRVTINQKVIAGAVIGAVGHTGGATGPHLHFEVREKGTAVDPVQLLAVKKG